MVHNRDQLFSRMVNKKLRKTLLSNRLNFLEQLHQLLKQEMQASCVSKCSIKYPISTNKNSSKLNCEVTSKINNHNLRISRAPLKSLVHQGTSLFWFVSMHCLLNY